MLPLSRARTSRGVEAMSLSRKSAVQVLLAKERLGVAVLVDVDGTLVGPYRNGKRELRDSAYDALAILAEVAPVFLWSIVRADNGDLDAVVVWVPSDVEWIGSVFLA